MQVEGTAYHRIGLHLTAPAVVVEAVGLQLVSMHIAKGSRT